MSVGVVLAGSAWTGVALADDPTPDNPVGEIVDGVTGGGSGSGGSLPIPSVDTPAIPGAGLPALPALPALPGLDSESNPIAPLLDAGTTTTPPPTTTPTTTTSGSTTTTSGANNVCTQLIGQLTGLFAQFNTVSDQLAGLDPTGVLGASLTARLAGLQSQINNFSLQLANNPLCTATGGGAGGSTGTVPTYNPSSGRTDYSVRYPWNHGHRFYDRGYRYPKVQVQTTQVRSVPKGGVDTGDGSF